LQQSDPCGKLPHMSSTNDHHADEAVADTHVAASLADATLQAPAQPHASTLAPDAVRTTVLPRLAVVGDKPELMVEARLRYEPGDLLGEGGGGEVRSAKDQDIGRRVALKRLRPEHRSTDALLRFVQEIRTTGQLEHPNIVPIHDVGVDERGDYYFVMKHIDGETLASIIARLAAGEPESHRRFTLERRVEIFRGLLEAVAFAHSRGIIHRDIKPANVMVGRFGEVLLMDWGVAKSVSQEADGAAGAGSEPSAADMLVLETSPGALVGTPLYMSPEQARGEPVTERSEVYSLCILFYELLCLQHPLSGLTRLSDVLLAVVDREIPSVSKQSSPHQPAVPWELTWFLKQGLAKDPEQRYPSVAAMIERLDRRAEGDIPIQCPFTLMKRATTAWSGLQDRHPLLVLLLLLLLLGGGLTGLVRTLL
jgi:eukaryotic-like serine/threonine-protein kinase